MSNYKPAYPANVPVDDGVKDFITTFYGVSDTPGKNDEWVSFFKEDATLVMEKKEATGKAGMCFRLVWTIASSCANPKQRESTDILKVREGMWEKVEERKHTVFKVFPLSFSGSSDSEVELMLYGNVVYRLKGEQSAGGAVDWAGYAKLVRGEGEKEWKFAYYRVYIQR